MPYGFAPKEKDMVCDHENEHAMAARRAAENMPGTEEIARVAESFKALSESSRLKILFALRHGEMCVYHIVEAVGGTQSAVSHQLRILKGAGIVKARRDGQNIVYSLADEHVVAVLELACTHQKCKI